MLALTASALALAACAGNAPPPHIRYDNAAMKPALLSPDPPKPVEIVEVPKPLSLPG